MLKAGENNKLILLIQRKLDMNHVLRTNRVKRTKILAKRLISNNAVPNQRDSRNADRFTFSLGTRLIVFRGRRTRSTRSDLMVFKFLAEALVAGLLKY